MKNANYVYSTSEVAGYYGLTGKGLAFYEEKGIIAPKREQNNKYRVFSLDDCYSLYHSKLYSNCEFTLLQTVNLLKKTCTAGVETALLEKAEAMRKEAWFKGRVADCAEHIARVLEGEARMPFFEIVERSEKVRLFVRKAMDEHVFGKRQSEEFENWNRTIPINVASLKYSLEEIQSGKSELNVDIGNIIDKADFDALGYPLTAQTEVIPAAKCLYTVLKGDADAIDSRTWLMPALDYLENHNLRLIGDPITAMLVVVGSANNRIRYEEAWFPIE
jgi:DNA-binding transcriptional MerR regulator